MGHILLGHLPAGKRWDEIVQLLRFGGPSAELADATAHAAEKELEGAKGDPALVQAVWLLTQLPLAARSSQFAARLVELGLEGGTERSLLDLISSFSRAIDRHVESSIAPRTDLGELARQAATEALASVIGSRLPTLFETTAYDVKLELARLGSKAGFALLAREFFARLTQKFLEYYVSRELPQHVGPGKFVPTIESQIEFRRALETHCWEASFIVEQFAGGWFSKANYLGRLTPNATQNFVDYALKKVRDELRARRVRDD
jgi:hypothetical protein